MTSVDQFYRHKNIMSKNTFNHDNTRRKFVRWRAAIIPKHYSAAIEGKIIEASFETLIMLSATALKPGSEARFVLEVFEQEGERSNKKILDLNGKIIDNTLIGHISLFRHQIQLQNPNHPQLQLLKKLTGH